VTFNRISIFLMPHHFLVGIEQGDIILSFGSVTDIPSMPHTRALAGCSTRRAYISAAAHRCLHTLHPPPPPSPIAPSSPNTFLTLSSQTLSLPPCIPRPSSFCARASPFACHSALLLPLHNRSPRSRPPKESGSCFFLPK
jgi:hypothetical protein